MQIIWGNLCGGGVMFKRGWIVSYSGAVKIIWKKKWMTRSHYAEFAPHDLLQTWRDAHPPKRRRESHARLWKSPLNFYSSASWVAWNRCWRLIFMAGCKSWRTLLSKLWTDLCRSGLYGAREVMKHAWNAVESLLPFLADGKKKIKNK